MKTDHPGFRWTEGLVAIRVKEELAVAREKWPSWPTDQVHAAAIVGEEVGELIKASLHYTYENRSLDECDQEAIHTIVTAIRFLMGE